MSEETGKAGKEKAGKDQTAQDQRGQDDTQRDAPRTEHHARAHDSVEEIEIRLGGLFDAVSGGFREMADRMRPLADAVQDAAQTRGRMHVDQRVRVGSVAEFIDTLTPTARPAPEHAVRQTATDWSLEATLPDTTLPEIRIDIRRGKLTLDTQRHHLTCALPDDVIETTMEMSFQSATLHLKAPRGGPGNAGGEPDREAGSETGGSGT